MAGDQVGRARAGGGHAHAHLARSPGIAVGRVARALLVPHQDVVDVRFVQGVVERDDLPPGNPNMVSTPSRLSASRITVDAFMVRSAVLFTPRLLETPGYRPIVGPGLAPGHADRCGQRSGAAPSPNRPGLRPGNEGYVAAQHARTPARALPRRFPRRHLFVGDLRG